MNKPIQAVDEQRKRACNRLLVRQFSGEPTSELGVIREYFYYGNIQKYLADSKLIVDMMVFEATPFTKLEDYLDNIKIYWEWVLEYPQERGNKANLERSVSERLLGKMQYYALESAYLTYELKRDLFFWFFGKAYCSERLFPMPLGPDQWQPEITLDVDWVCSILMSCIRKYLMGYEGHHEENLNGQDYIDYFLSIYPHMSAKCFALNCCTDRFYEENGKQINLTGYQFSNRWFIAGLHNILTVCEEEEEIDRLVIHDQKALNYLKECLDNIDMPNEYYELEKFVIKHGEDCIDASE